MWNRRTDDHRGGRPEVGRVTEPPATDEGTDLRDVTVEFAETAEFSQYGGTVRLHDSGWVEVPELRRLFPPDAVDEIRY